MARTTKTAAVKPTPATLKAPRVKPVPAAPTPAPSAPARTAKAAPTKAAPSRAPAAATATARTPPPSKGELRAHIEKLEAANAALKAKGRETNRAAKAANSRIAALEAEVVQLQEQASRPPAVPKAEAVRGGRPPRSREIDPGDAVPPGVAVLDPEPLDAEAEAARDALEENLSDK